MTSEWFRYALVLLALGGFLPNCIAYSGGIEVGVTLEAARATWRFETDAGDWVQLQRAEVAISGLELVRCEDEPLTRWDLHDLVRATARAHTDTGAETDARVDLLHDAMPYELGMLFPPPGEYCGLRVTLEVPEEREAFAFAGVMAPMVDAREFALSGEAMVLDVPLETRLTLRDAGRTELVLDLDQRRLFDGIRVDTSEDEMMRQMVANLQTQLSLHTSAR